MINFSRYLPSLTPLGSDHTLVEQILFKRDFTTDHNVRDARIALQVYLPPKKYIDLCYSGDLL